MIILFGSTGYIGSEFKLQLEQKQLKVKYWPNTSSTTFNDLEKWYESEGYPYINAVINAAGYTGNQMLMHVNYIKKIQFTVILFGHKY